MISSPFHRMAMLALATADSPKMFISTVELEAPAQPYTIETLGRLQTELQPARLFFVMGADSFGDVTSWREYEAILSEYDVVVAMRPGHPPDHPGHDAYDGDQIGGGKKPPHGEEVGGGAAPPLGRRKGGSGGGAAPRAR